MVTLEERGGVYGPDEGVGRAGSEIQRHVRHRICLERHVRVAARRLHRRVGDPRRVCGAFQ